MITASQLDGQRDYLLINHSAELPDGTLAHIQSAFTAWERIANTAEILYAVRQDLTSPWRDHLLNLLGFITISGFPLNTQDVDRSRSTAMIVEVNNPGENPPESDPLYLPVIEDED